MYGYEPFEIRFSDDIRTGTAEAYHWFYAGEPLEVLFFQSQAEYDRWTHGEPFRLINHWTKQARPPKGK